MTDRSAYVLRNIKDMHFEVCNICNLSCRYCSAHHLTTGRPPFMPLAIAKQYLDLVLNRTCAEMIDLMFYGGEAMLQSVSWFYAVLEYARKRAAERNKTIRVIMQSNATLLDTDKLELIRQYDIGIGTSLDGPAEINEQTRSETKTVIANISRLKEIGCFGGLICTVSDYNYDRIAEVMRFFEANQIFWVAFNIVYSIGRGIDLIPMDPHKIFLAHKNIYLYMEETLGKKIVEGNMAEKLARYVDPPSLRDYSEGLMCNNPFCGGGITAVLCDSKGDLYPCGCANMTTQHLLGNVASLDEQAFLTKVCAFHKKDDKYFNECRLCNASRICNFGCPGFRTVDVRTEDAECGAAKMFYSFLQQRDQKVIAEIVRNFRLGKQEHAWRSGDHEINKNL